MQKLSFLTILPEVPFQLCQFHQFKRVTNLISKRPQLLASQELRQLMFSLKKSDEESFCQRFTDWKERWKLFLNEKSINPLTQEFHWTHLKLRKAMHSIQRNLPYLFTYQQQSFPMPNTTNSLDSFFGHLKAKTNLHRGASTPTLHKLISSSFF